MGRNMESNGEESYLTREGYEALLSELEELEKVRRKEVAQRIRDAVDFGDLSENSEYADAKEEQAFIEGRIARIKAAISRVKIIEPSSEEPCEVVIGGEVEVEKMDTGERCTFRIVGPEESQPLAGKISFKSPVGSALLGKRVGDEVLVRTPDGEVEYRILGIKVVE